MSSGNAAFAAGSAKRLVPPRAHLPAPGVAPETLPPFSSVRTRSGRHCQCQHLPDLPVVTMGGFGVLLFCLTAFLLRNARKLKRSEEERNTLKKGRKKSVSGSKQKTNV